LHNIKIKKGREKMPKKRKKSNPEKNHEKTCWHIYNLQNLNSEKFIKVVNKILERKYILIK